MGRRLLCGTVSRGRKPPSHGYLWLEARLAPVPSGQEPPAECPLTKARAGGLQVSDRSQERPPESGSKSKVGVKGKKPSLCAGPRRGLGEGAKLSRSGADR